MFFRTVLDSRPGTQPTARERRHEQTRREILDASWQLAEETGIAGLSLREVARSVGMQAPSIYTYFDSKDALFDAMFAEGYRQLGEAVTDWITAVAGEQPADALGTVIGLWIKFCQDSFARYQIMFTRAIPRWQPSADAYAISVREYERMAEELAALGIEDAEDLDLYTAVASGLAAQQMANDPFGDRWVRLAPTAARMLLHDIERKRQ
jgi:AcrR family transcriptional regulator